MKKLYTFILVFFVLNISCIYSQVAFTDVTSTAGVAFNSQVVESLAWGDYDNDGDQDLFLSTDGQNRLMRNDGNDIFTEVSTQAGLTETFATTGCAFADLDNDGDLDLYVVSTTINAPDLLYENLGPPNYNFQSISSTVSGISFTESVRGMAFLDYNRDGLLDIYVNTNSTDLLYKNLGNLKFSNVAASVGITAVNTEVGAVPTDINNDGWIDIFTGNRSAVSNKLFLNNGTGSFTNISTSAGINEVGLGMGVLSFDYDNDLDMDLYWTAWPGNVPFTSNALYQNQGNNTFLNKAIDTQTTDQTGWGISCNAGDIDNDRFEDFFVSNGFSKDSSGSILFKNNNGTSFQDITQSTLGSLNWDARGVAFADYDNDGDLDVCLTGGAGVDTKLWRNDTVTNNNWITFNLEGTTSNKSAIGARIEVTAGGLTTVKEVSGGAGRGSFNSLPVEFGLGAATTINNVKVRWPNGNIENFNNVTINQFNTIKEGATLAVDEFIKGAKLIKLFPNPFKNHFTIDLSRFDTVNSVKIYNSLGQIVFVDNNVKNNKIDIELNSSYKGMLYVSIKLKNGIITKKLLKL